MHTNPVYVLGRLVTVEVGVRIQRNKRKHRLQGHLLQFMEQKMLKGLDGYTISRILWRPWWDSNPHSFPKHT